MCSLSLPVSLLPTISLPIHTPKTETQPPLTQSHFRSHTLHMVYLPHLILSPSKKYITCFRLSYFPRTFSLIKASTSMVDIVARETYSPPSPGNRPATQFTNDSGMNACQLFFQAFKTNNCLVRFDTEPSTLETINI